jgi:hypothetical protein
VQTIPLVLSRLQRAGLYTRTVSHVDGRLFDDVSGAPMSTEFALSRFLVPLLCQRGPAVFMDSDVLVLDDVWSLLGRGEWRKYAVSVVKHAESNARGLKMGGQIQNPYHRKNWSSVMLFNCDHPAWAHLSLYRFNATRGLGLHQ